MSTIPIWVTRYLPTFLAAVQAGSRWNQNRKAKQNAKRWAEYKAKIAPAKAEHDVERLNAEFKEMAAGNPRPTGN